MSGNWRSDQRKSTELFERLVWPAIGPEIDGGDFVSIENERGNICELLDQTAGIDGFQVIRERGVVRSIACRAQPVKTPWNTFTIRYARHTGTSTEYEKRLLVCREKFSDWMKPALTIHGYVDEDCSRAIAVASIRTYDLFIYTCQELARRAMGYKKAGVYEQDNTGDGNVFLVTPWQSLIRDNVPVTIWPLSIREEIEKRLEREK